MKTIKEESIYSAQERIEKTFQYKTESENNLNALVSEIYSGEDLKQTKKFKNSIKVMILNNKSILNNWNDYNNKYINYNNLSEYDDEYNFIQVNPMDPNEGEIDANQISESIYLIMENLNQINELVDDCITTNKDLPLNFMYNELTSKLSKLDEDEKEEFEEMDSEENLPC